jgi:hypothetical protein
MNVLRKEIKDIRITGLGLQTFFFITSCSELVTARDTTRCQHSKPIVLHYARSEWRLSGSRLYKAVRHTAVRKRHFCCYDFCLFNNAVSNLDYQTNTASDDRMSNE